jgi:hypothetical protein
MRALRTDGGLDGRILRRKIDSTDSRGLASRVTCPMASGNIIRKARQRHLELHDTSADRLKDARRNKTLEKDGRQVVNRCIMSLPHSSLSKKL